MDSIDASSNLVIWLDPANHMPSVTDRTRGTSSDVSTSVRSPETQRLLLRRPRVVGLDWMLLRSGIHAIHTWNSLSPEAWPFDAPPLGVSFVDQHIKLDRATVQCQHPRFQNVRISQFLQFNPYSTSWTLAVGNGGGPSFFCARKDEKDKSYHVNFRRVCDHRTPHARMGTPHLSLELPCVPGGTQQPPALHNNPACFPIGVSTRSRLLRRTSGIACFCSGQSGQELANLG